MGRFFMLLLYHKIMLSSIYIVHKYIDDSIREVRAISHLDILSIVCYDIDVLRKRTQPPPPCQVRPARDSTKSEDKEPVNSA